MRTLLLALLAVLLWAAVLDRGIAAFEAEAVARDAVDRCLFAGGLPADCMEVLP